MEPVLKTGDLAVNDYNVWPHTSAIWVPGNSQFGGFHKTWEG